MRATSNSFLLQQVGTFRQLPTGRFLMGNERPIELWEGGFRAEHAGNGPVREVCIHRSFSLMTTPVTVAAYRSVFGSSSERAEVFCLPSSKSINDRWQQRLFDEVNTKDTHPVVGVTWNEANAFCEQISMRHGVLARLPTEQEWEYACRAGSESMYFWGESVRDGFDFAWSEQNSGMEIHAVASKKPNAWELFDMAGNVWEWCASRSEHTSERPIRGGSACHHATAGRSAHRYKLAANMRNAFLGFRCVLEL